MIRILFLIVMVSMMACNPKEKQPSGADVTAQSEISTFYVGTYTNVKSVQEGGSQGIYQYSIDDMGKLSKIGLAAVSDNPSFLAKTSDGKHIVAVNEINSNEGNGTVESYRIEEKKLKKMSTSSSGGAHPCHVSVNENGQVLVANYTGGNVGLLNVSRNGTLSDLLDVQQHKGNGAHERQDAPHAHSSWFRPDGKGVISVDLGTNELWFSEIENNKFVPQKSKKMNMKPEAGPRHLVFHPNSIYLYVLNELDNTVGLVSMQDDGSYSLGATYSMLPDGYTEFSKGADIHMSQDGRFLYASNRGHNSIVIYSINKGDGSLSLIGTESVKGDGPRNFQLAMNDRFLVVANEKSDNIVSFKRNSETGRLTFISEVQAPAPVCLLF